MFCVLLREENVHDVAGATVAGKEVLYKLPNLYSVYIHGRSFFKEASGNSTADSFNGFLRKQGQANLSSLSYILRISKKVTFGYSFR